MARAVRVDLAARPSHWEGQLPRFLRRDLAQTRPGRMSGWLCALAVAAGCKSGGPPFTRTNIFTKKIKDDDKLPNTFLELKPLSGDFDPFLSNQTLLVGLGGITYPVCVFSLKSLWVFRRRLPP